MADNGPYWIQLSHVRCARLDLRLEGVVWSGDDATESCWWWCCWVSAGHGGVMSPPSHTGDDATESCRRWRCRVGAECRSSRCHRRPLGCRSRLSGRVSPPTPKVSSLAISMPPMTIRVLLNSSAKTIGSRCEMCWSSRPSISSYGYSRLLHGGHQLSWFRTMI
jgi:hypothetical protein